MKNASVSQKDELNEPQEGLNEPLGTQAFSKSLLPVAVTASAVNDESLNRRKFSRVALDAVVQVTAADKEVLFTSRIRDLSENGVFILTPHTRPIGTGLNLRLEVVLGGCLVKASGIIVHEVTAEEETPMRPAGVGVMFTEVWPETVEDLQKLLKTGKPLLD